MTTCLLSLSLVFAQVDVNKLTLEERKEIQSAWEKKLLAEDWRKEGELKRGVQTLRALPEGWTSLVRLLDRYNLLAATVAEQGKLLKAGDKYAAQKQQTLLLALATHSYTDVGQVAARMEIVAGYVRLVGKLKVGTKEWQTAVTMVGRIGPPAQGALPKLRDIRLNHFTTAPGKLADEAIRKIERK